jgi:DNA-3-methyladenine glycosylase
MPLTTDIGVPERFGDPLPVTFFDRDPRVVALELLGCVIRSTKGQVPTAGRIVETEAYLGADDPGSHAATRGITARNSVMYGPAGHAYVYFTYGNHYMLNLVCGPRDTAGAVLLRALEPLEGIEVMSARRGGRALAELCNGPGKLAQALGVDLEDNSQRFGSSALQVYAGMRSGLGEVETSGRVGLTQGHDLPYRYFISGSRFVSRGRLGPSSGRRVRSDLGGSSS